MIGIFFQELMLFAAAQVVGLFVALKGKAMAIESPIDTFEFGLAEIIFLAAILLLFIYFVRRFSRKSVIFFRLILALVIFAGSQTVFSLIFNEVVFSTLVALLLAVLVLRVKVVLYHNIGMILAVAGVGAVIGLSLAPIAAVLVLLAFSFYDIIAVYKTKHMIKMAEGMIKARAISGIVIPQTWKDWFESLENVQPGGRFMILGSGDLTMPLILASSVAGLHGLAEGLTVVLFSMVGLFLTYWLFINQRTRRPMAALPPIAVMAIIGYLVALIL